jgi:glyoxylase-like metal-dependent hydrolase (beta-lactamase superfamily II)
VSGGWIAIGGVELLPLRDATVDYPWPLGELFPGVPADAWAPFRERYPAAFADPGTWRSAYRCYLIRTGGRTVLVDTGMGAAGSPLSAALGLAGRLRERLADAAVEPAAVDFVVLTHLHPDHVGGALEGGAPAFPNARYLVQEPDWTAFHDPEVQRHFPFPFVEQTVTPLQRLGVLELVDGEHAVTDELTLVPAPGHTPGHVSVLIESRGERVMLVADALLHPAQVTEPDWSSMFEMQPERDRRTRAELLERLEAEGSPFAASHFPDPPLGRIKRIGGRRWWEPL